jgi:hypothetical protein
LANSPTFKVLNLFLLHEFKDRIGFTVPKLDHDPKAAHDPKVDHDPKAAHDPKVDHDLKVDLGLKADDDPKADHGLKECLDQIARHDPRQDHGPKVDHVLKGVDLDLSPSLGSQQDLATRVAEADPRSPAACSTNQPERLSVRFHAANRVLTHSG